MVQLTAQLEPVLKYIKSGWDFAVGAKSIRLSAACLSTESVETAVEATGEAKNLIRDRAVPSLQLRRCRGAAPLDCLGSNPQVTLTIRRWLKQIE
jgi:hypothetical protein